MQCLQLVVTFQWSRSKNILMVFLCRWSMFWSTKLVPWRRTSWPSLTVQLEVFPMERSQRALRQRHQSPVLSTLLRRTMFWRGTSQPTVTLADYVVNFSRILRSATTFILEWWKNYRSSIRRLLQMMQHLFRKSAGPSSFGILCCRPSTMSFKPLVVFHDIVCGESCGIWPFFLIR